jgi:hypothetical protein
MDNKDGKVLTLYPKENDKLLDIKEVVKQLAGKL